MFQELDDDVPNTPDNPAKKARMFHFFSPSEEKQVWVYVDTKGLVKSTNPDFDEKKIDNYQELIIRRKKQVTGTYNERPIKLINEEAYNNNHQSRWVVKGTTELVGNINRAEITDYHKINTGKYKRASGLYKGTQIEYIKAGTYKCRMNRVWVIKDTTDLVLQKYPDFNEANIITTDFTTMNGTKILQYGDDIIEQISKHTHSKRICIYWVLGASSILMKEFDKDFHESKVIKHTTELGSVSFVYKGYLVEHITNGLYRYRYQRDYGKPFKENETITIKNFLMSNDKRVIGEYEKDGVKYIDFGICIIYFIIPCVNTRSTKRKLQQTPYGLTKTSPQTTFVEKPVVEEIQEQNPEEFINGLFL